MPQGRNIFPELSVRHNLELGATAAPRRHATSRARIESVMDRFPVLREQARARRPRRSPAASRSCSRSRAALLLDPKLMLIDEPSIGLSPRLVQETFAILQELRAKGMTILMVEQNAKRALEISDFGVVLELGRTRLRGRRAICCRPARRPAFLGGATL